MKKEKHIFVLNILHEDRFGGPGKRIINVSQLLNKRNIKTTICLPYGSGNIEEAAKKGNIPVIRLPFSRIPRFSDLRQLFKWIAYLPRDLKSFYSCFKNNKPDLVHINGAFFFVPAVAAKMVGVPLVWHMNDTMPGPILARFFGIIVKLLADRIVTAAEAVAEHYGVDKVPHSVLYAPVNTSLFSYIDYKRTKKINTIPKVSLIANWNRIKGIDNFIQAMAIVIKVYGPVEIHFAGEKLSNHRKYIQNIEQQIDSLNIRQFVYHHGFINSVETLLETMDVHVLSSLKEACPMDGVGRNGRRSSSRFNRCWRCG